MHVILQTKVTVLPNSTATLGTANHGYDVIQGPFAVAIGIITITPPCISVKQDKLTPVGPGTMSKATMFTRAADLLQRGVVLGLISFTGFQVYQIGRNAISGRVDSPYMQSTYFNDVEEKVKEEYRKDNIVDRRDWYQAEDDSYLKDQVRPNITKPEFKHQLPKK